MEWAETSKSQNTDTAMELEIKVVGKGDVRTSNKVRLIITSNPQYPEQAEMLRAVYRTLTEGKDTKDDTIIRAFFGYEEHYNG